ncbi:kinase/pyrophosphorylase [Rhodobacteraceae bacterium NNCM2]|nr:kinase/pyrophosphorylase [Coraliihabitans acroporae]
MPDKSYHIHLISDSTGETLLTTVRAVLAPFEDMPVDLHQSVFVRSDSDLAEAIAQITRKPGMVFHTLVNAQHRAAIEETCAKIGQTAIPLLDPLIARVSEFLGVSPKHRPGMQYRIDNDYFDRIAAMDFAIAHDDGALGSRLLRADVILTGVSRTSKTPTCIYLAYRSIKAANMPLVPGVKPDPAFFQALEAGVPAIGLTASPTRLSQIRTNRLEALGDRTASYADLDLIREEVADARLFFERHDLPVIDVTRRSIEETAAEILAILRARNEALE